MVVHQCREDTAKMKNRIDTSRQKTPWDSCKDRTILQSFVMDKYKKDYKLKHPKLSSTKENDLLNSIEVIQCKLCSSENIIKRGKTNNGIQLYYCKQCNKRFTITTNTIFENHKISITEWVNFLLDLFNYGSTTLISKVNKNSINTAIYWLHKIFLVLKNYQDNTVLKHNVYIDEMFYKVIKSDIKTKDGKQFRGISRNQYCIGIGYDGNNVVAIVEGLGKTTKKLTLETFNGHIEKGAKLIHDDEKSHKELVKELQLKNESYNSILLKTKKDKDNPLRPINHQCDLIRQFLNTHSGFNRDDLQDYLNLYCFMNSGHKNKLEKVEELLLLALNKNVSLSYRDFFKKDGIE